mmetsp:Transcript_14578/g.31807  ORF Transcript_14578/g.31807 Transcript_14578/m.31807 type:complete len:666 (-) Transcript_14578:2336-4333(-)
MTTDLARLETALDGVHQDSCDDGLARFSDACLELIPCLDWSTGEVKKTNYTPLDCDSGEEEPFANDRKLHTNSTAKPLSRKAPVQFETNHSAAETTSVTSSVESEEEDKQQQTDALILAFQEAAEGIVDEVSAADVSMSEEDEAAAILVSPVTDEKDDDDTEDDLYIEGPESDTEDPAEDKPFDERRPLDNEEFPFGEEEEFRKIGQTNQPKDDIMSEEEYPFGEEDEELVSQGTESVPVDELQQGSPATMALDVYDDSSLESLPPPPPPPTIADLQNAEDLCADDETSWDKEPSSVTSEEPTSNDSQSEEYEEADVVRTMDEFAGMDDCDDDDMDEQCPSSLMVESAIGAMIAAAARSVSPPLENVADGIQSQGEYVLSIPAGQPTVEDIEDTEWNSDEDPLSISQDFDEEDAARSRSPPAFLAAEEFAAKAASNRGHSGPEKNPNSDITEIEALIGEVSDQLATLKHTRSEEGRTNYEESAESEDVVRSVRHTGKRFTTRKTQVVASPPPSKHSDQLLEDCSSNREEQAEWEGAMRSVRHTGRFTTRKTPIVVSPPPLEHSDIEESSSDEEEQVDTNHFNSPVSERETVQLHEQHYPYYMSQSSNDSGTEEEISSLESLSVEEHMDMMPRALPSPLQMHEQYYPVYQRQEEESQKSNGGLGLR